MVARAVPVVFGNNTPREFFSENCVSNGIANPCGSYEYAESLCCPPCTHPGADIQAVNEPVYAVTDGVVVVAKADCEVYTPNWVVIQATVGPYAGDTFYYAHLSSIASGIIVNAAVTKGQRIGTSGTDAPGCVPTPNNHHLHFEHRTQDPCGSYGEKSLNPVEVLTSPNANGPGTPTPTFDTGDIITTTDANVNLREGAGTGFPVMATMPAGRKAIVVSGPTRANEYDWYKVQTRYGRGYVASDFIGKATSTGNLITNPTANQNLDKIFANREASTISRVSLDGSYRVKTVTAGSTTTEGVRYESGGLNRPGVVRYFAGVVNQVKGTPGKVLDYVRTTAYYTDGGRVDSSPVLVYLADDWKTLVTQTVTSEASKTVNMVSLRATVEDLIAMTFYTDNVWVVEL